MHSTCCSSVLCLSLSFSCRPFLCTRNAQSNFRINWRRGNTEEKFLLNFLKILFLLKSEPISGRKRETERERERVSKKSKSENPIGFCFKAKGERVLKKTTKIHNWTFRKVWRPKTALSPKKIALWPLWIVSCTSFFQVGDLEETCRTLDCWDSHFPTNKGPKYLQYSNSLNNTCIFRFLQMFSAMSTTFHHLHTHRCFQTGPFDCFEVFPNPLLTPDLTSLWCSPSCVRPLSQAFCWSVSNTQQKAEQEAVCLWTTEVMVIL